MSWEAVGAISELIAAIGVIASLTYLATQIRASSRASKVEARLTTSGFMTRFNDNFIHHPEIYELWNRARTDPDQLSADEYARFSNLNMNACWLFSAAHYQQRIGTLDAGDWFELEAIMKFYLNGEGVTRWWKKFSAERFDPAFVAYVNEQIIAPAEPHRDNI